MTEIRYAKARQHYTCAGCRTRIARGMLYAYALASRKRRTRYTCICDTCVCRWSVFDAVRKARRNRRSIDRRCRRYRRCRCHRGCAPAKAQYTERRAEKGKTDDPD